jgi:hypothetical protein
VVGQAGLGSLVREPIKVDTCDVSMIQSVSVEKRGGAGGEIIGEEGTGVMQVARREHAQEAFFKHSCSTHRKHAPTLQQQAHRLLQPSTEDRVDAPKPAQW